MDDICKNIKEYNPKKPREILTVFDDMIAYTLSNNKLNPIVTGLSIRGKYKYFSCFYYTILFRCSKKY